MAVLTRSKRRKRKHTVEAIRQAGPCLAAVARLLECHAKTVRRRIDNDPEIAKAWRQALDDLLKPFVDRIEQAQSGPELAEIATEIRERSPRRRIPLNVRAALVARDSQLSQREAAAWRAARGISAPEGISDRDNL